MATQAELSPQKRYDLITRGIEEVLGGGEILKLLEENERPVRCYWGTAPTGRPHVGYLVPLTKLADFLRAGVQVKVLFAGMYYISCDYRGRHPCVPGQHEGTY